MGWVVKGSWSQLNFAGASALATMRDSHPTGTATPMLWCRRCWAETPNHVISPTNLQRSLGGESVVLLYDLAIKMMYVLYDYVDNTHTVCDQKYSFVQGHLNLTLARPPLGSSTGWMFGLLAVLKNIVFLRCFGLQEAEKLHLKIVST